MVESERALTAMLPQLVRLRRELHQRPELSGGEWETAARLKAFFAAFEADFIEGLGGTGLAVVFRGEAPGPTVMVRAELDALPIVERNDFDHASVHEGVSHKCGHDGHAVCVAALAPMIAVLPRWRGRLVLLFQPAEETGQGAQAVLADPRFAQIQPDYAFALHNVPGYPRGQVLLRSGTFNCGSRGVTFVLRGRSAHAAHPEQGCSPAGAMCALIGGLSALSSSEGAWTMVTVVGALLGEAGEPAFGTAPGEARVMATLRAERDEAMARLVAEAETLARSLAERDGLGLTVSYHDVFDACINDGEAVACIERACARLAMPLVRMAQPWRWSEDFGRFGAHCRAAMFALGAGRQVPKLHHADYDFPDPLIEPAARLFFACVHERLVGPDAAS